MNESIREWFQKLIRFSNAEFVCCLKDDRKQYPTMANTQYKISKKIQVFAFYLNNTKDVIKFAHLIEPGIYKSTLLFQWETKHQHLP